MQHKLLYYNELIKYKNKKSTLTRYSNRVFCPRFLVLIDLLLHHKGKQNNVPLYLNSLRKKQGQM